MSFKVEVLSVCALQKLAALRAELRPRMMGSPLGDGPAFVARLECVYRSLWRRHCARAWAEQDSRADGESGADGSDEGGRGSADGGSVHGGRAMLSADGMAAAAHGDS